MSTAGRDKHVFANFWRRNDTNDFTPEKVWPCNRIHIPLENEHWNWDWWSTDECYKLGCQDSMDLSGLLLEDFMATYHNF